MEAQGQARSKKKSKASFSQSPLAKPQALIHSLAGEIQNYLHFPDPSALYVALGTVAANMIHGNPVWLILVGPPGSGKTEIIEMFKDLSEHTRTVSSIDSPAALLSGTARKEIGKGATGGILREVGSNGMLLMTDMAGMLKLPVDPLGKVLAAFRDIYGGHWVRAIGAEGGRSLVWGPGNKLTFIAASTPAIDRHHSMNAELGERWIYYRFPESDSHGETQSALRNKNPQEGREVMRQHVRNFFGALDMSLTDLKEKRDFTGYEEMRLECMAQLSARMRSDVPRDGWTKQVIDIADPERPQRLATVLGQLYLGLEAIGLPEGERWWLVGKVATDSVPRLRAEIVKLVAKAEGRRMDLTELGLRLRMLRSQKTVDQAVEDLSIHNVVEVRKEKGEKTQVGLSSWASELFEKGWA